MAAGFIHLRMHTAFSLLEGAIRVKNVPDLCRDANMPAAAITDTGNMFGAFEFSEIMAAQGLQPIIGCTWPVDLAEPPPGSAASMSAEPVLAVLALLAKDAAGYAHLLKLSSCACAHPLQALTSEDLAAHAEGLICLTGGARGPLQRLLAQGQATAAAAQLGRLKAMYGDRLYVEVQRHGDAAQAQEAALLDLAYDQDVPLVASNEPYFPAPADASSHRVLLRIAGNGGDDDKRPPITPEHWFKGSDEMMQIFSDLPEAIENTVEIARRCAFRPQRRAPMLPRVAVGEQDGGEDAALRRLSREGLTQRLAQGRAQGVAEEVYHERLEHELDVIINMEFAGYFLIVADFVQWAHAQGIVVGPGRGSGAASLVAYALTITDLDPLRFGLLFERFLNPDRVSMPDFDIDFCQERRDEVIDYVRRKYGPGRVAQIITLGGLKARAVLRDVGRVMGLPYGQVDRLCKLVSQDPARPVTLAQALEEEPRLAQARDEDEAVARLLETGRKLEGLYRHASTHAAGVVISERPLDELVPMIRDPRSGMALTQFTMQWVEQAGLIKFDFLGLKTLTVLEKAAALLLRRGVEVDIAGLRLDDAATFAMLNAGHTIGVFQLEGAGVRHALMDMQVERFEHIAALTALYRPGPMENIPRFISCKQGRQRPDVLHPLLEPTLAETYGVIVYQEQVMEIARVLSGYSLSEADLLRRAMGKKIRAEMEQQEERFVSGAMARGVPRARARHIFRQVEKFAGYGFNKSHATGYALVAYRTAWFKAHYPVEFLAASMTLDMGNTDRLGDFRREAARLGIAVHPPCVNASEENFTVVDGGIAYALGAVRNVGRQAMAHLVAERRRGGPFRSLADFAGRMDPRLINKRALEFLAKAGALDALHEDRAQIMAGLDRIMAHAIHAAAARGSAQESLFDAASAEDAPAMGNADDGILPPGGPAWSPVQRHRHELEAVGFYLSGHPLGQHEQALLRAGVMGYGELVRTRKKKARLAGTILEVRRRRARSGNAFAFVRLAGLENEFEMAVFSELLDQSHALLETGMSVVADVEADWSDGTARLRAKAVCAPDDLKPAPPARALRIFVDDPAACAAVRRHLHEIADQAAASATNGRSPDRKARAARLPVSLILRITGPSWPAARDVEVILPGTFTVSPALCTALNAIPGVSTPKRA